jgi:hypothetical protein
LTAGYSREKTQNTQKAPPNDSSGKAWRKAAFCFCVFCVFCGQLIPEYLLETEHQATPNNRLDDVHH